MLGFEEIIEHKLKREINGKSTKVKEVENNF